MKPSYFKFLLSILSVLFLSASGRSQCIITPFGSTTLHPGDSLLLSVPMLDTTLVDQYDDHYMGGLSARSDLGTYVGQTFRPGYSGLLLGIEIGFFHPFDCYGRLGIYNAEVDQNTGLGILGSPIFIDNYHIVMGPGNNKFMFPVSVNLVKDHEYLFILWHDSAFTQVYGVQVDPYNKYNRGSWIYSDGFIWTIPVGSPPNPYGSDLVFATYMSNTITYNWSDGSDSSSTVISSPGTYFIHVHDTHTGFACYDQITINAGTTDIGEIDLFHKYPEVYIFDLYGRFVGKNRSELITGTYIVKFVDGERILTKKVVLIN
jgi:hypothetical protein